MKGIFGTVLALSLCGSIMILELLILKPLIRNRVTKAFQYYIWLVVILRLMIPFSSDINLFGATADIVRSKIEAVSALGNVSNQTQNDMASDTIKPEELTVPEKNSVAQNSTTEISASDNNMTNNRVTENSMADNNTSDNSVIDNSLTDKSTADYSSTDNSAAAVGLEKSIDTTDSVVAADKTASDSIQSNNIIKVITNNLWVIWLAGVCLALFRLFYQYYHFIKKLEKNTTPVTNTEICFTYVNCCNELGLRKQPSLYTSSVIKTPIMIGMLSPKILLPEQEYNQSELRYALLHELNHYKRHDIFYKWTVQIIACIHWFNPLVYIMAAQIKQAGELACDEAVINTLASEDRKEYGLTLINLAAQTKPAGTALCLNESKKHLKERLTAILKFNKSVKRVSAVTCILLLIVIPTAAFSYVNESKEANTLSEKNSMLNEEDSMLDEEAISDEEDAMSDEEEAIADEEDAMLDEEESIPNEGRANVFHLWNDSNLNIEYNNSNSHTENVSIDLGNSLGELVNNVVDASLDYAENHKPEKSYTYDQLEKLVYPKAKLIEKDFDDVKNLDISLVSENVILKQGGDKVHIKYYQWYDNQYNLSLKNGRLTFKNVKDKYLKINSNTYNNVWLPEVLKHMGYEINPEDPKDHNGTVVITVPKGITLKSVGMDLVAGSLTISNLSADTVTLENVSGNIDLTESYMADLSVSDVSGKINATTIRGNSADIENVSGYTLLTDCQYSAMDVNNVSGGIKVDGGSGELSVENTSGDTYISNKKDRNSIEVNSNSGKIGIILDDISAYHIEYSSFSGSMKVGSKNYKKEADLNSKANKELTIEAFSSPISIEE